jgi:high-affinity nickel permease
MLSIAGLGFLLGMQHALEADHDAAVAGLTGGNSSSRQIMAHGATWGIGHALTLVTFGGLVLLFGFQVNDGVAHWFAFAVESVLGMVMLTGTIVFPASIAIRNMPNLGLVVRTMIGIVTIVIGAQVMVENWV